MSKSTLVALLLALAGCSTQPASVADSEPVPKDRILTQAYSKPAVDSGTLVIKRDPGLSGSACNFIISYNGTDMAVIGPGEVFAIFPPPGDAMIGARPKALLCPGTVIETQVSIVSGKTKAVRLGIDFSGTVRVSPTVP